MKSIFIAFVTILFSSCISSKTTKFLNECQKKQSQMKDTYYYTYPEELKNNLPSGVPLFYLGSDTSFHYFHYFYDRTTKIKIEFKFDADSFTPERYLDIRDNSISPSMRIPVYLSDI